MKKILLFSILAILAIAPMVTYGATFKTGQSYYLEPGTVINDNLYTAGGNVGIAGAVNGDVLASGGSISILGPVSGDIEAAGGNLNIGSSVGGSVRVAGGSINIANSVAGDLLAAGGQVNLMPGSSVGKDVAIAGGSVYIDGPINGNLQVSAGEVKLGPKAVIKGTFDYYSKQPATLEQGAVVQGATNFHKINVNEKMHVNKGFILSVLSLIKFIMIFVAALVMLYFFRNQTNPIVEKSASSFWKEALRGFIVLVVVPIAVILSFITVVGAFLGIIVALFYGMVIVISSVISVLLLAKLSLKYLFKKENYQLNWWIVAISALVLGLIAIIPFVGWIFTFIIFISAFGSTSDFIYKKIRS
jgi:hypothetical protein